MPAIAGTTINESPITPCQGTPTIAPVSCLTGTFTVNYLKIAAIFLLRRI